MFYAPYDRVLAACEQANIKAACAKWLSVTGESLNTLEAIAVNRVMLAWNDTAAALDARDDTTALSGWLHVTVFNALSEHSRFLHGQGNKRVEQFPEYDEYASVFPLETLWQDKDEQRAQLSALLAKNFTGTAQVSLPAILDIVHAIIEKYVHCFSRREWEHIHQLATAYHPNERIVRELKRLCVQAFKEQKISDASLQALHNVYEKESLYGKKN